MTYWTTKCAAIVFGAAMASCNLPRTRLEHAQLDLRHGRLVPALVRLDGVEPADDDYVEARALAVAIERRIRAAQDLVARGLALRAEWRDQEALESFEKALEVWPRQPGAEQLIAATRARLAHVRDPLADGDPARGTPAVVLASGVDPVTDAPPPGDVLLTSPVDEEIAADTDAQPAAAADAPEPVVAPVAATETAPPPSVPDAPRPTAAVLAADLDQVRQQLARGAFDDAIAQLDRLRRGAVDPRPIDALYVAVLHQRALLLYGKGEVSAAIRLWEQLLQVDGDHAAAGDFVRAARAEVSTATEPVLAAPR